MQPFLYTACLLSDCSLHSSVWWGKASHHCVISPGFVGSEMGSDGANELPKIKSQFLVEPKLERTPVCVHHTHTLHVTHSPSEALALSPLNFTCAQVSEDS